MPDVVCVCVCVCVCVSARARVFAEMPRESECCCHYAQVREQPQQLVCEKRGKKEKGRKRCGSECEAISDQGMRRAWVEEHVCVRCVCIARMGVFVCVCVCVL